MIGELRNCPGEHADMIRTIAGAGPGYSTSYNDSWSRQFACSFFLMYFNQTGQIVCGLQQEGIMYKATFAFLALTLMAAVPLLALSADSEIINLDIPI